MLHDWDKRVSEMMDAVHTRWRSLKDQLNAALGIQEPIQIVPYRGYGTPEKLWIKGRVLKDEGITAGKRDSPIWENVLNMYRRFETDEIPGARIRGQVAATEDWTTSDEEGFFELEFALPTPLERDRLWQPIHLQLQAADYPIKSELVQGEAIVVSEQAEFGVISDIDDTIMHTASTNLLEMIWVVYLGNAYTRQPFPGVGSFYHALQRGQSGQAGNPIFYVSSSAWNVYDLFVRFMEINAIPRGPIQLRDIELAPDNLLSFRHELHKREQICPILEAFPDLPFILIGDTGQQDAEIYAQLAEEYPGRILAIYLRDVSSAESDRHATIGRLMKTPQEYGTDHLVFAHTSEAAHHAAQRGWMAEAAPGAIASHANGHQPNGAGADR